MNSSSTLTFGDIFNWTIGVDSGSGKMIKVDITMMGVPIAVHGKTSAVAMKSMGMQKMTGKMERSFGV